MLGTYLPLYSFAFFFTLLLTFLLEAKLIPLLKSRAAQPIYDGGPAWHMSKEGTPTMGGVGFLIPSSLALFLCSFFLNSGTNKEYALSVLISALFCIGNAAIGFFDDLTKLKRKQNAGLSPMQKLAMQSIVGGAFLIARHTLLGDTTVMKLFFFEADLGWFYYPVALFLILGIVNCANLTDGIDGLASSVAYGIGISLFLFSSSVNPVCATLASVIVGSSIGFLFFNINPAKIFMGDTGSLFLGSLVVSAVFAIEEPALLIPLGSVYVIEGVSVVLQVFCFKLTKKRLFIMAPLHHHLEKQGMSENKICLVSVLFTLITAIIAITFCRI